MISRADRHSGFRWMLVPRIAGGVKIADQAYTREHLVFRRSLPRQFSGVSEKERSLRQTAPLFPDRSASESS